MPGRSVGELTSASWWAAPGGTSGSSNRSTEGSPSDSWTSTEEKSAMLYVVMKVYDRTDETQYAQSVLLSAMRGPIQKRPRVEQPITVQASQPRCAGELRGHIPCRERGGGRETSPSDNDGCAFRKLICTENEPMDSQCRSKKERQLTVCPAAMPRFQQHCRYCSARYKIPSRTGSLLD